MIDLGITQFIRPVGGIGIDKDPNIGWGGGYRLTDLPEGVPLEVYTTSTHDPLDIFREGDGRILFTGNREEIAEWNIRENGW